MSMLLAFSFQDHNYDVEMEGFEIKFSRADESLEHSTSVYFARRNQFHHKGLLPATRYRFRISTRSSGRVPGRHCGEFDTIMPDVGPPLAPKAILDGTVSFNLQWEAPENDSVKHYKLDYWMVPRFDESITHTIGTVEPPKTSYTLSAMQPCRRHQLEISPRGKPMDRGNRNGPHAKNLQHPHVMKVIFTTDCTKITGTDRPVFTL